MVKDALWKEFGVGNKSLCMACFERRMGRKIEFEELTDCMMNTEVNPYTVSIFKLKKS
jgi:hypothetical protein